MNGCHLYTEINVTLGRFVSDVHDCLSNNVNLAVMMRNIATIMYIIPVIMCVIV
jgi:hypothetical protein